MREEPEARMTNVRLKLYRRGASKSKQASLNHGKGLHWIVAQLAEHAAVNRVVAASSAAFPAFHSKLPDTLKAFTQRAEVIRSRPRLSAVLETGSRGLFPEIGGGRGHHQARCELAARRSVTQACATDNHQLRCVVPHPGWMRPRRADSEWSSL